MKQNYQLILDRIINTHCAGSYRPTLLLHACCAPCSSYVLEYLSDYFDITLFFYNPNISPKEEHDFRLEELSRLTSEMGLSDNIKIIRGNYEPEKFRELAMGLEDLPEGGARCAKCYALRLEETAKLAAEGGYDFFTTTLSISPYKNAEWLNTIGDEKARIFGVRYLTSDFKKRNGYKRSCELSAKYGLYRQDFCGCEFSKRKSESAQYP